jgi:hypothetical protein
VFLCVFVIFCEKNKEKLEEVRKRKRGEGRELTTKALTNSLQLERLQRGSQVCSSGE